MVAARGNGNGSEKYRKLAEHELQLMDDFSSRLGSLETTSASTDSRLNMLVRSVEKIASQIEKMSDRTRPNIFALVTIVFGAFALIATYGALAFSPVFRTQNTIMADIKDIRTTVDGITATRFTPVDARNLKTDHDHDMVNLSDRIYRNEHLILDVLQRTAKLEGKENQ